MSMLERLKEELESPEGKARMEQYWKNIEIRMDNEKRWAQKIAEHIQTLSKEELEKELMSFLKWEEAYEEYWYSERHTQTHSCIFGRVMDAFKLLGSEFEEQEDFLSDSYIYKNYIFKTYCGQGCFTRILDISKPVKDEVIFQTT